MLSKTRIAELKDSYAKRREYVGSLLAANPMASVADIARMCAADGIFMRMHEIRPLRAAEKRAREQAANAATRRTGEQHAQTSNEHGHPVVPADQLSVEATSTPEPTEPVTPEPTEPVTPAQEGTVAKNSDVPYEQLNLRQRAERKRLWAIDWLYANPKGEVKDLLEALVSTFGSGIKADDMRRLWHEAREVPIKKRPSPKKAEKKARGTSKEMPVGKMAIKGGGTADFPELAPAPALDLGTELTAFDGTAFLVTMYRDGSDKMSFTEVRPEALSDMISLFVRQGTALENIRVWKPAGVTLTEVKSVKVEFLK